MATEKHDWQPSSVCSPDEAGKGNGSGPSIDRRSTRHVAGYSEAGGVTTMKRYAIVIERGPTSYGAYIPDLPGCIAVGESEAEVRQLIKEAMELHLRSMKEDGDPIPEPTSSVEYIALAS